MSFGIAALAYSLLVYFSEYRALQQNFDRELVAAAQTAREVLRPEYSDREAGADSAAESGYAARSARLDPLLRISNLERLWSAAQFGSKWSVTADAPAGITRAPADAFHEAFPSPEMEEALRQTGLPQLNSTSSPSGTIRTVWLPFGEHQGRPEVIGASRNASAVESEARRSLAWCALAGIGFLLAGLAASRLFARSLSGPLERLTGATHRIAEGDFLQDTNVSGAKEIEDLGAAISTLRRAVGACICQLQESHDDLNNTLNSLDEAVISISADAKIVRLNNAAAALTGWSESEAAGRPLDEVFRISPSTLQDAWERSLAQLLRSGLPAGFPGHTALFARSGAKLLVSVAVSPIRRRDGRHSGAVIAFRNLSGEQAEDLAKREALEHYRLIADNTTDVMWTYDIEQERFPYVSQGVFGLRGYTAEEVQQQHISEFLTPEAYAQVCELIRKHLAAYAAGDQSARVHTFELDQLHKNGSVVYTEVVAALLPDDSGKVKMILGVSRDISARKQAEKQLNETRERLDMALRAGGIGTWEWDVVNNVLTADSSLFPAFGMGKPQETLQDFLGAIHPDDRPQVESLIMGALASTSEYAVEYRVPRPDRTTRFMVTRGRVYRDGSGKPIRMLGVTWDDTARRNIETALRASEEKFSKAFYTSPDSININRLSDGLFLEINNGFTQMTGYTASDVLGRSSLPGDLGIWVNAADRTRIVQDLREKGECLGLEALFQRKDGTTLTGLFSARIIEINGEQCVISVTRDITDRKRAEEALIAAKTAADLANEAKSSFLANMSHEIRTLLNAIIGMSTLALETTLTPEQNEYLTLMRSASQSLLEIVNGILDFSKIEAGKFVLARQPFSLRSLIRKAALLFAPSTNSHKHQLSIDIAEAIPDLYLGDALRLSQILINLLGNAIKFTPDTRQIGVRVRAGQNHLPPAPGEEHLLLTVWDNGIGIPPEEQEKIFGAFTQVDNPAQLTHGGTGLGLAITKRLVELMGGRIWVESSPGSGSAFHVALTLPPAPPESPHPEPAQAVDPDDSTGTPLRILVVEDNAVNQKLVTRLLEKRGHRVAVAGDGNEALVALSSNGHPPFDVILMDCQLPVLDGFATTQRIRASEAGTDKHIPIIAMTAFAIEGDRERCLNAGMDDYVSKPLQIEELLNKLRRLGAKSGRL